MEGDVSFPSRAAAPYYDNAMLGGNELGIAPVVNDDAGTPFTVILIPVDDTLAIKTQEK